MCRNFMDTGRCKYGRVCQFAHSKAELKKYSYRVCWPNRSTCLIAPFTGVCLTLKQWTARMSRAIVVWVWWNLSVLREGQHGFLLHLGNSRVKAILLLRLLTVWGNDQPSQWCHYEQRDSHDPFPSIKSLSFVHNANNVPWSEDYQHDNPNSIVYYRFSVLETQIVTTRETQFYRKQIITPLFYSSIHDS